MDFNDILVAQIQELFHFGGIDSEDQHIWKVQVWCVQITL